MSRLRDCLLMSSVSGFIKEDYMDVIVIKKDEFISSQYSNIKNIAFTTTSFIITRSDDQTVTYLKSDYLLAVKW
jgi:hypothetical protein